MSSSFLIFFIGLKSYCLAATLLSTQHIIVLKQTNLLEMQKGKSAALNFDWLDCKFFERDEKQKDGFK